MLDAAATPPAIYGYPAWGFIVDVDGFEVVDMVIEQEPTGNALRLVQLLHYWLCQQ